MTSHLNSSKDDRTSNISRRDFLKLGGAATIATLALGMVPGANGASITVLPKRGRMLNYNVGRKTPSICTYCAGGCGLLVTSLEGSSAEMREGDIYAK
ncbi:MAG: twin-arginine translocation signal domain-containing protein, partial [Nitrososphaerales archaeon]